MALLDLFRKKKKPKEQKVEKLKEKAEVFEAERPKIEEKPVKTELKKEKAKKTISDVAWRILRYPHVSEKATQISSQNWYTFEVYPRANKTEIKRAVEEIYGVNVVSVRLLNVPPKRRRRGRIEGWRKGYKKAVVKIKEGQKIEVLPR